MNLKIIIDNVSFCLFISYLIYTFVHCKLQSRLSSLNYVMSNLIPVKPIHHITTISIAQSNFLQRNLGMQTFYKKNRESTRVTQLYTNK